MTSGVYQLNFSDGSTYIGKSIHIEERWKQHMNKFYKGTAAKPMQAAFRRCGDPTGRILVECHEDHIDVVESCYISRCKPILNSDRPKDPYPDLTEDQIDHLFTTFVHSARDLVAMKEQQEHKDRQKQKSLNQSILELETEIECLKEEACVLTDEADRLLKQRSEEEIKLDIEHRILDYKSEVFKMNGVINLHISTIDNLRKELSCKIKELEYERRPWWKKIFS